MQNLGLLLFVAIGVVYIVLGMLYESYIHPLTILSGLPSAGLGALVTLYLFGNELNIYSFVGLVMLIGIVKKNAIMQIDFALEAERQHGKIAGRRDLRRLPDPLPPDHDDDDGGAARRGADRARLRRRRRSAASARARGRRRPGRLAADHAVSDAGRLHVHGGDGEDAPDSDRRDAASDAGLRQRLKEAGLPPHPGPVDDRSLGNMVRAAAPRAPALEYGA